MLTEINRKLVLHYDPGQFTFRHFIHTSSDTQLYVLARSINSFQTDTAAKVLKVQEFEMAD